PLLVRAVAGEIILRDLHNAGEPGPVRGCPVCTSGAPTRPPPTSTPSVPVRGYPPTCDSYCLSYSSGRPDCLDSSSPAQSAPSPNTFLRDGSVGALNPPRPVRTIEWQLA